MADWEQRVHGMLYAIYSSDFKRKILALKSIPASFSYVWCGPMPNSVHCWSLTLQEIPCLSPAGSAGLQPQEIASSLHLHGFCPSHWWHLLVITTFFHLHLLVSALAHVSSLSIVPLTCQDQDHSLWTHPVPSVYLQLLLVPFSWSSGSAHLQHKGTVPTAVFLCVVTINSVNYFYEQIITIISGNSTEHCIEWSLEAPCYVGHSFTELSTPKPLGWWSFLLGSAPLKRHFLHCPLSDETMGK